MSERKTVEASDRVRRVHGRSAAPPRRLDAHLCRHVRYAGADFAALVLDSTRERLRVWLYSFHERPVKIGLRLWRLAPGEYVLKQGRVLPGEKTGQNRCAWQPASRLEVLHRADAVSVDVPPNASYAVDLRLEKPVSVPAAAPDLAVHARDVRPGRDWQVTLHNIGNAPAGRLYEICESNNSCVIRL